MSTAQICVLGFSVFRKTFRSLEFDPYARKIEEVRVVEWLGDVVGRQGVKGLGRSSENGFWEANCHALVATIKLWVYLI